jgi:hypothetical protein
MATIEPYIATHMVSVVVAGRCTEHTRDEPVLVA